MKKFFYLLLLASMIAVFTGTSFADNYVGGKPLETIQNDTVTGDLLVDSYYGFNATDEKNVTYTFNYTVPQRASIKNATLYVLVYMGSMQAARQTYINVTYNGQLLDSQSLYDTYNYTINGGNNNTWLLGEGHDSDPYLMLNDHTMRVTSDYLLWYDVKSQTGTTNWANVCTTGSFDGRIKLITLIVAYDMPGSSTLTRYWVNVGHDVSSYNDDSYTGETQFNGSFNGNVQSATLMVVHAASQDGLYTYNNQNLQNGTYERRGSYSGYELWDIKDLYSRVGSNSFTYRRSTGNYYKVIMAVQKVKTAPDLKVTGVSYNPSNAAGHQELFANEPNTIRVTVLNNGTVAVGQFKVKLTIGDYTRTKTVEGLSAGSSTNVTFDDFTPPVAGVVTVNINVDCDSEVDEVNETNNIYEATRTVYYNGYKGKRYTGGDDINTCLMVDGRLGLIYSTGNSTYRGSGSGAWQNPYIVTWTPENLVIPVGATVKAAILYQAYTWNTVGGVPDFTATFNGANITPAAHYNDTKGYGSYNYPSGLFVYNVTDHLRINENNTLVLTGGISTTTALYGSYLLVIYEHATENFKRIWINDGTDLLYSMPTYGVNNTEATAYANFNNINSGAMKNATAIILTASANEDNKSKLYFNSMEYTGFWADYLAGPQLGFSVYNVTGAIQDGANTARIQSYNNGSNGDNLVAIGAILVLEYQPPVASFTANATEGVTPIHVQFQDTSTWATEWLWDFGDGTNSTEQNPLHTYTVPGKYTVKLTVKGPGGEDTTTRPQYITALRPADITATNLTVTPASGVSPLNVTVRVNLTNSGEVAGNYTAELKVNGAVVDTQVVTVSAGSTVPVTFNRVLPAGNYNVTVGNLTAQAVSVLRPANVTVANFTVTPASGVSPLNVTVRVNLTNSGDVAGNYTAVLYINGIPRTNQTVTVAPGSTVAVTFRVALTAGTHTLRLDNLSQVTLRALTPLRVVSIDPRNNAAGVSRIKAIVIKFNQNIAAGTAYRSITVRTSSGRLKYIRKRISGNRLIITPVGSWNRRTRYIITVPGNSLKTGTGVALASQFRSSFRTR
ncbi:DUF3344 domain-containing protein [Methanothermobacter sp. KEPCO 2]|uniref:DUF3344 domain-containing protein n=1 Tax=Methanothermobacter sp. KEPCO 2 TaxID=3240977 RepID=UPI0035192F60